MFPCRKKRPPTIENRPPADTQTTPSQRTDTLLMYGRGHNEGKQGATDYQGESEWKKYGPERMGGKISRKTARLGTANVLIDRPSGVGYSKQVESNVREAKRRGVKFVILLHFNKVSYRVSNPGVEILIKSSKGESSQEYKMADHLSDSLNEDFGIPERRKDGVFPVPSTHAGADMLDGFDDAGICAILLELAFLGHDTPLARRIVEQEDMVCSIIAAAAHDWVKGNVPDVD